MSAKYQLSVFLYPFNNLLPFSVNLSSRRNTVVVDYSSPNIAKPFHLGHFRATVTGNFVYNINKAAGHKTIGINYLGDWGTQFDLLARGFEKYGDKSELIRNPLRHLYNMLDLVPADGKTESLVEKVVQHGSVVISSIYVKINQEQDQTDREKGQCMQPPTDIGSNTSAYKLWTKVREITMDHLKKTYARMNVEFTAYEYESDYVGAALATVTRLVDAGLAFRDVDDVFSMPTDSLCEGKSRIVLLKSNGSTLYLTRDIAAAISRFERYQFDRIHYVVEDSQRLHFQQLQSVLSRMGYRWASPITQDHPVRNQPPSDLHIPFGRVLGASTRHGKGLFLSEILSNARQVILGRMKNSPNTRVLDSDTDSNELDVADHLGVTCLVTEILRNSRQKPVYLDSFLGCSVKNSVANPGGSTDLSGLGLQYCHARLCSMEKKAIQASLVQPSSADPFQHDPTVLIRDLERLRHLPSDTTSRNGFLVLLDQLRTFPETVRLAYTTYEPSVILQYSTRLTSNINAAWKELPVLSCKDPYDRVLRIAIFMASRNVLASCLQLLGVKPLRAI